VFCFNCGKGLAGFLNESKTNLFVSIGVAADGHTATPPRPTLNRNYRTRKSSGSSVNIQR
jgi:hypothetical protein